MTAAARRGCVNVLVEYGGKAKSCRVTETALLRRARVSKEDTSSAVAMRLVVIDPDLRLVPLAQMH
jgi:hypothetical protein